MFLSDLLMVSSSLCSVRALLPVRMILDADNSPNSANHKYTLIFIVKQFLLPEQRMGVKSHGNTHLSRTHIGTDLRLLYHLAACLVTAMEQHLHWRCDLAPG